MKKIRLFNIVYSINEEDLFDNFPELEETSDKCDETENYDELQDELELYEDKIRSELPKELIMEIPDKDNAKDYDLADYISDETGWLVDDFDYEEMK